MTRADWKCVDCNHEMRVQLDDFMETCPNCGCKYEKIDEIVGLHSAHSIPIFIKQDDDMELAVSPNGMHMIMNLPLYRRFEAAKVRMKEYNRIKEENLETIYFDLFGEEWITQVHGLKRKVN